VVRLVLKGCVGTRLPWPCQPAFSSWKRCQQMNVSMISAVAVENVLIPTVQMCGRRGMSK
jgi:hypothetical protein